MSRIYWMEHRRPLEIPRFRGDDCQQTHYIPPAELTTRKRVACTFPNYLDQSKPPLLPSNDAPDELFRNLPCLTCKRSNPQLLTDWLEERWHFRAEACRAADRPTRLIKSYHLSTRTHVRELLPRPTRRRSTPRYKGHQLYRCGLEQIIAPTGG